MTDKILRAKLIRLAHANPKLRAEILPLVARGKTAAVTMADIAKLNELTDDNAHGESLQLLAEKLGMKKQVEILKHVNSIHKLDGSLHPALGQYREDLVDQIHKVAKTTKVKDGDAGKTVYDLLD